MKKYFILFLLIIVFGSCSHQHNINHRHTAFKRPSNYSANHATPQQKPPVGSASLTANGLSKIKLQKTKNGSYEVALSKSPKKAKQFVISVAMTAKNATSSGYLAVLDRAGNLGIGVDFSWSTMYPYAQANKFIRGVNDQVKLHILVDKSSRFYAVMAKNNQAKELMRTAGQPFLHPAFSEPSKLEFAVKGDYTIETVEVRNL